VACEHRTTAAEELMGLCHSARAAGHKVMLESDLSVYQPVTEWAGAEAFMGVV